MASRLPVGVLGCGAISKIYLQTLTGRFADRVEVVAVADVVRESAESRAKEFSVPRVCTPDELIADGEAELLLNLTPAPAHYELSKRILAGGKHLYTEKPLALTLDQARELYALAASKRVRLSVAPDTLLGAGVQTCKRLIDSGRIGTPVAATGFISVPVRGEKYFTVFRGPWLDLGPYHVGALVTYFGKVRTVTAVNHAKRPAAEGEAPLPPEAMTLDNPAQSGIVLEFANGVLCTLLASAEVSGYLPALTIYGTKATLTANDPNMFDGTIKLRAGNGAEESVPLEGDFAENARGVGVWEMAGAIAEGRPHALSAESCLHATEVLLAGIESGKTGRRVELA